MEPDVYPGTDIVVRICYGCDKRIRNIDDAWADSDESEVVCTTCKDLALAEYPEAHFTPARDL